MDQFYRDLQYAARTLRQNPGYAIAAILALALGIGGNASIFSVINTVLLRPLPYGSPERIVRIYETNPAQNVAEMNVAPGNFDGFRSRTVSFSAIAAGRVGSRGVTSEAGPVRISAFLVTTAYFDVLGVHSAQGRTFLPEEDAPGSNRVVILSDRGWRRLFRADPNIVGKRVTLDGESYAVIGVMPRGIEWPSTLDMWMPLALPPEELSARNRHNLTVLGRVKPGVALTIAEDELRSISASLAEQYPETNAGWSVRITPLYETIVHDVRPALVLLLGAVSFVLLIACTNVANLMLVRVVGRHREVAIRIAMGAGRRQIVSQLLAESVLLTAGGACIGLSVSLWLVNVVAAARPDILPRFESQSLDPRVVAYTAAVSVVTALLFGLAPALQLASTEVNSTLRSMGRGSSGGRGSTRFRSVLVACELALSLVLLVGTGLLVRSLSALYNVDAGFQAKDVLVTYTSLPEIRYFENRDIARFFERALDRIRNIPGVESAGGVSALPLTPANLMVRFHIEGTPPVPMGQQPPARFDAITPGYLETLRIPLKRGRTFTPRDNLDSPRVALISEALARLYFPDEDPIGKKITFNAGSPVAREIVGIVGDVKHQSLDEGPRVAIYDPVAQTPLSFAWIAVRGRNVTSLAPAIRSEFGTVDRDQPLDRFDTMEDVISESMFRRRLAGLLVGSFALLAAILASVGIYGVIACSVEQRRKEIGVRLALGAEHCDVLRMVLKEGLTIATFGVFLGTTISLAATRLLRSMLYQVTAEDPVTYLGAALLMLAIATVACYIPARRVTAVDPSVALRSE